MSTAEAPSRPELKHGLTSPDLVAYMGDQTQSVDESTAQSAHGTKSSQSNEHTEARHLLEKLISRQNDHYRRVKFTLPKSNSTAYEKRVSFDTINLQTEEDLLSDDEEYRNEYLGARRRSYNDIDARGRGTDVDYILPRSPGTSPTMSPTRMRSPLRGQDMSALFRAYLKYPTTPILTRKCCTVTRLHKDFEDLYLGNLESNGLRPVLPGRVILVYVSGRKHTWVSIDWILRNFVENGDIVVIVSAIPAISSNGNSRCTQYSSPENFRPMTEKVRQRQRSRPEFIKHIAANLMQYALTVVDPKSIVKITVEIAEGKTKEVLKDMYKLYEPNIVSTGSKMNSKNSAPLKSWHSSRLSDRLVKNFPLPVIVVPASNLSPFEVKLASAISNGDTSNMRTISYTLSTESDDELTSQVSLSKLTSEISGIESDAESISDASLKSEASTDSEASLASHTSFDEIAELYNEYRADLEKELRTLRTKEIDEQYFSNFMRAISDSSQEFCVELKDVNPDFKGQGAVLARLITGSNQFGAVPYKTKSMLAPVERRDTTATAGTSYSDIKKSLKRNSHSAHRVKSPLSGPTIKIDSPSPSLSPSSSATPRHSVLTFQEHEKPSSRTKIRPLKKYLSHEESSNRSVDLAPSKSQPQLNFMLNPEEKKKNKRKKFWKLF